jgi:hypothetical protein
MQYLPFIPVALGLLGSILEATGRPSLVAIGKRLESLGLDLPKLWGGK